MRSYFLITYWCRSPLAHHYSLHINETAHQPPLVTTHHIHQRFNSLPSFLDPFKRVFVCPTGTLLRLLPHHITHIQTLRIVKMLTYTTISPPFLQNQADPKPDQD